MHQHQRAIQRAQYLCKNDVKKQKNIELKNKIEEVEQDFKQNTSLFKTACHLKGKPKKTLSADKDQNSETHPNMNEVLKCWQEHFSSHLNTAFPHEQFAIDEIPEAPPDADSLPPISTAEIESAIKRIKYHKAPGIDSLTSETLRAGGTAMVKMLHKISTKYGKRKKHQKTGHDCR